MYNRLLHQLQIVTGGSYYLHRMDITPLEKDVVLSYLASRNSFEFPYSPNEAAEGRNASPDVFKLTIDQLEQKRFLDKKAFFGDHYFLKLKAPLFDFIRHGGFQGEEELLRNNIEKLLLEIENLKKIIGPNHLETANKIASIGNAIIAGLALFK